MRKKINFSLISAYIFIIPSSLAYTIVVTNDTNNVQIPYVESLNGLAPDSVGGWLFPGDSRVYDKNNLWITSGSMDVKEGDRREIKLGDVSSGKVLFQGKKNVTFYMKGDREESEVLDTVSLNAIYQVQRKRECTNGRMLTEAEFEMLRAQKPDICRDTSLWGGSPIGMKTRNNGIKYYDPRASHQEICVAISEDTTLEGLEYAAHLCVSNPDDFQVFAYGSRDFSAGTPVSGASAHISTYDEFEGRKIYHGNYSSFKIGENVEVHAFPEDNLGGDEIIFKSGAVSSSREIKSFFVKSLVLTTPSVELYNDAYASNKMNVVLSTNQGAQSCSISIDSSIRSGEKLGDVFATLAALDEKDEPYKTERIQVPISYGEKNEDGLVVPYAYGSAQLNMAVEGKTLTNCIVSKLEISGMGRAKLDFSGSPDSATATWYNIPEKDAKIDNPLHAAQLLAEPLVLRFTGESNENHSRITRAYYRSEEYENLRQSIVDGSTGVAKGYYTFSVDFLELETREAINEFLLQTVINPAYQLGIIDEALNNTDFAEELRRELMAELNQDAWHPYGSAQNLKISIAMMFSGLIPEHWQRNGLTNNSEISIESLLDIESEYMNKPIPPVFAGSAYSSDDKGNDKITSVELLSNLLFTSPNKETRSEAYQELFGRNPDIQLNYRDGFINNRTRYGGYLGETFLRIAADIFKVKEDKLTPAMKIMTKTALESMGIDTVYSYGSLRNIKSSVLHRISGSISIPEELEGHFQSGGAPEMLDSIAEKMKDKGVEMENMQKQMFYKVFVNSDISAPSMQNRNDLWNAFIHLEKINEEISELEGIVKIEKDGTPLYAIPISDEQFAKSILYECGVDAKIINDSWEAYYMQQASPPSLSPLYRGVIDSKISQCHDNIMEKFKEEYGRDHSPVQLWNLDFKKAAQTLGNFAGAYTDINAKLRGKTSWNRQESQNSKSYFIKGFKRQYTELSNNSINGASTITSLVHGRKWVIANSQLNYSIKTVADTIGMMYLNQFELIPAVNLNLKDDKNPLWWQLNDGEARMCGYEDIDGMYPKWYSCFSDRHTHSMYTRSGTPEQALAESFKQYMIDNQAEFKTVTFPIEKLFEFLKSLVPFWGTIEAIEKGDLEGTLTGMVSDMMFIIPMGSRVDDIFDSGFGAVKPGRIKPGIHILGSPIGVNGNKGGMSIGGRPNKQQYKKDADKTIPKIPNNVMNKFNNTSGISATGKPSKLPLSKPDRLPELEKDKLGVDSMGSKYFGDKKSLKDNGDGTFLDEKGKTYIKDGENYYSAERDTETGDWFLTDKDGNRTEPVKKDENGDWKSDSSAALTENDMILMGAQKFFVTKKDKQQKNGNGLILVNGKVNVIKVGNSYFKAEHDPVHKVVYIYTIDWDRTPLLGPRVGKWFKDHKKSKYCTFAN